jgi:type I restriction enzyme S subunit
MSDIYNFPIPLPPLAEQKRIVAKIEELFAEIDKLK